MKKKMLNSSQLGLLSAAFMKNLFPKPLKGELLVDESLKDGSCILYFLEEYHNRLDTKIREKYYEGAFAKSNAEKEWIDLMSAINTVEEANEDATELKTYWISIDPDAERKPKIEIDKNKLSEILNSERAAKIRWIGDIMENLSADIKSVYVGYSLQFNFNGYISLAREIETSPFATKIELVPILQILKKYQVEIDSLEIMKLINPDKINATIYLKK